LAADEYFALLTGGRQGLIDTAAKTSQSGDLHHRVNRNLQDLYLEEDWRVSDERSKLISTCYGGDGFDVSQLVRVNDEGHIFHFFADLNALATKINSKYGWVKDVEQVQQPQYEILNLPQWQESKKPRVTKYEMSRAVAERANQLINGSLPLVKIDTSKLNDPIEIANEEFEQGVLPINVIRYFPNGEKETVVLGFNL
jgi:DNA-directed RNA polymerase subunit K/omega